MLRFDPAESLESPAAAVQITRVYGLPMARPASLSVQFSPANLSGNFGGPTLTVDGELEHRLRHARCTTAADGTNRATRVEPVIARRSE
jgi:hypothetical protein